MRSVSRSEVAVVVGANGDDRPGWYLFEQIDTVRAQIALKRHKLRRVEGGAMMVVLGLTISSKEIFGFLVTLCTSQSYGWVHGCGFRFGFDSTRTKFKNYRSGRA